MTTLLTFAGPMTPTLLLAGAAVLVLVGWLTVELLTFGELARFRPPRPRSLRGARASTAVVPVRPASTEVERAAA